MSEPSEEFLQKTSAVSTKLTAARNEIKRAIYGQDSVIDQTLITLIAGGHALIIGVPGLAKTKLIETISCVLALSEKRIQFTPDLMPADIIGAEILEEDAHGKRKFRFVKGPIFAQLLMADEINRASPRTQSALLQAMQEHEVTVAGDHYALPEPFHVLATQNPIEQEGTYPLPEAQLDRFLLQIDIDYPSEAAEREILLRTTGNEVTDLKEHLSVSDLREVQSLVRDVPVGESVVDCILDLVRRARPGEESDDFIRQHVAWGPGPRASQALMLTVRARALLHGRIAPSVEDVMALAAPVLKHRMAMTFSARADGLQLEDILEHLCQPWK